MWLKRLSILPVMAALSCSVIAGLKDGKLAPDGGTASGGTAGVAGGSSTGGTAGSGTGGTAGSGTGGTAGSGTGGTAGSGTGGTAGSGTGGTAGSGTGGSAGSGTGGAGGATGGNYAATVLADGPVGYWRLDETSGTTAKDSSGHGHDGVLKGTVGLGEKGALTGDPDTAFYFDGTSSVDLGDNFGFSGKAPFTIEAWVYPQAKARGFLGKANYTTTYVGYFLAEGAGALQFVRENAVCAWTANTLPETKYSYVVGTFDGINWTLYVDGNQVATKAATNSVSTITDSFTIGDVKQWKSMLGWIDEVALYDKALTAAQVTAHYNAGIGK